MDRRKTAILGFLTYAVFCVLATISSLILLVRLYQMLKSPVDMKPPSKQIKYRTHLCAAACPGRMNCTEWSDCIFHQPDSCNNIYLQCFYEDSTLFSEEVLTIANSDFNWHNLEGILTIDLLIILVVIGLFVMTLCLYQSLLPMLMMMASPGANSRKTKKIMHRLRILKRDVYAAASRIKYKQRSVTV